MVKCVKDKHLQILVHSKHIQIDGGNTLIFYIMKSNGITQKGETGPKSVSQA